MSNKYLEKIAMTAGVGNLIKGIKTTSKLESDMLKGKARNIIQKQVDRHIPTGGLSTLKQYPVRY
jgi:hypothetical protein